MERPQSFVCRNGHLRVKDGRLVNQSGAPIQLCGVSTHNFARNPHTYNEQSLTALVCDWHITLFRIAVYTHEWGGYCRGEWLGTGEYDQRIDHIVDFCVRLGIYCIIDWHILNEGSGNPNATTTEALRFFRRMASTHQGKPNVIYEICNEPNGVDVTWSRVRQYAEVIIPAIREVDPHAVVICGTPTWSQDVDVAATNPLPYENLLYALHFYAGTHGEALRSRADKALALGLPIFVSEFGLSKADGNGGVFTHECDEWMAWMNRHKLSWANWSYSDIDETSALLRPHAAEQCHWTDTTEAGAYVRTQLRKNAAALLE